MNNIELTRLWGKVKEELIGSLPESAHPWIYSLEPSGFDNEVFTVVTGKAIAKEWLKKQHGEQINTVIKKITNNQNSRINIVYDEKAAKELKKEEEKIRKKEVEAQMKEMAMENLSNMQSSAHLNLKYKFENFVVGENNKFAHSAALAVAKNPAKKFNPLFIYGNSGLGKTHLMQAIGHYILFNNSQKLKVKYTSTDDYINDFISNSRKTNNSVENMSKFNKKYTNIDVILIDDIQFIESKEKTMERMQKTFDTLYENGKQIVITSDRLPEDIPKITEALSSRFKSGLMVELTPPDFETRYEIIKKLAYECDIKAENEALKYIAINVSKNVRELEGAFTKVCAFAEFNNTSITLNLAKDILKCEGKEQISYQDITKVTADYYNVNFDDVIGISRSQNVSNARQMAIYLCRELTNQSFENIGEFFNRKHTTTMYAYGQIKNKISADNKLSMTAREIKQALKVI